MIRDRAEPEVRMTATASFGNAAPFGTAAAKHLSDQGDGQQEDAAADQCEAMEYDIAGDMDIDCPAAIADGGHRDERGGEHDGGRSCFHQCE